MQYSRAGRSIAWAVGITFVLGSLCGCGGSANAGGATKCGDYMKMSSSQQESVIKKFFEEKGDKNPSNGNIMLSKQSAKLYCSTAGGDSDPIRNIDG